MIFLLTIWYPGDKARKVGKKFFDAAGKLPPYIKSGKHSAHLAD